MHGIPTPGYTAEKFSADPLGSEAEMTPGPDDENPFDDPEVDSRELELSMPEPMLEVDMPRFF